ncbi:MAG: hypothetical protein R6X02_19695 [Enhygromyxa sp.]
MHARDSSDHLLNMREVDSAILSPRELLAHLSPGLQLEREVIDGYVLSDCYRLDPREPVRLELRRGRARIEVSVEPSPEHPRHQPMVTVAGLGIGYRNPAPAELAASACERVAELLRAKLGEAPRRWSLAPPSLRVLAEPIAAELGCEAAQLEADPDHRLLRRDFDAYQRLYGARPEAVAVSVDGQPIAGISIHYPRPRNARVPNSASLYSTSLRIAHRRRMRRYFASLGYLFDEDAVLRTVPTPTTYARSIADRRERAAIRPRLIAGVGASLRPIHWGALVRRNLLPVSVAPSWAVAVHQRTRELPLLDRIPCDVGMLPHDMGLHAAALHAVPATAWDELRELALARVRGRPLQVLAGPWGLLARLAVFFEGPITTRCWKAWQEADEPEDFERCFAPHLRELLDELREL